MIEVELPCDELKVVSTAVDESISAQNTLLRAADRQSEEDQHVAERN
jgi:hypothetical protein